MKRFLITLLFFFVAIPVFAADDIRLSMIPPPATSFIFHTNEAGMCNEILTISWQDGNIDIKYGDNVTKTEGAKKFFEFLKVYIEDGYEIVPKTGLLWELNPCSK